MTKNSFIKILGVLLVVGLLFAALPSGRAQAATLCVNTTGDGGCYTSIQAAITAASAGDTIIVAAGTYTENVNINKAIVLEGAGSTSTIIVGTNGNATPLTIGASGATVRGVELTHNYTQAELDAWNFNNSGVIFLQNVTGSTLENCKVTKSRNGVYINNARNNVLSGNTIQNNRTGINMTNYVNGTQILDNLIADNWTLGMVYYQGSTGLPTDFNTVTVTGNTFSNNWYSEILLKDVSGVSSLDSGVLNVTDNTFSDSPVTYTTSSDAALNEPSFANLKPVEFGGTAVMPATPLPTLRIYNVPGVTLQKDGKTLYVGAAPLFTTIQAAIDAASAGDVIQVAAGDYIEQLDITKNITLIGSGAANTKVFAPATLPIATDPASAIVRVHGTGVEAEISGFSISGPGPSGCGSIRAGVYVYDSAYLDLHDNKLVDIRDSGATISGCQNGVAISVGRAAWSTSGTATIKDNIIVNYQKGAIVVDNTGSDAVITGNTITGAGTTSITAQNGIQISRGATATISGNTVSGNSFHLDGSDWDWGATGVLLYQAGDVAFTGGNNFTGNDSHVYISEAGMVTMGAETFGASSAPVDNGYYVINYNDAPLDLTQATFPTKDPFELAVRIWDGIDKAGNGLARFEAGHVYVNAGGSIQRAIDLATAGDVIHVAAGTYAETLTINKRVILLGPNSEINPNTGTRGSEAVIVYPAGITADKDLVSVSTDGVTVAGFTIDGKDLLETLWGEGIYSEANNLTVKNNIVKNFRQIGIRAGATYGGPYFTGALIENNKVTSDVTGIYFLYSGIYLQGTHGIVRGNVVESAYRGIQIQPYTHPTTELGIVESNSFSAYKSPIYFNYSESATSNWIFRNNVAIGIASLETAPVNYFSGIEVRTFYSGNVVFDKNQIYLGTANGTVNYLYKETAPLGGTSSATPNWWGSILGPAAGSFSGTATFDPWCGDADCTFLVSATQPAVSGFYVQDGKLILKGAIGVTGGIVINEPLYILLKNGAVIQNSSPCFIVNSSNVHIDTESIGGAKCVPTDSANGIDVAAGLNNITIEGIEFDGSDQDTADGVHFAGAVSDIVLVDNYLHGLDGDGIEFAGDVGEIVDIQGNMFKNNTGYGINNLGANTVGAEYNSWGNVAGPAAGDGVNGLVTSTPFTHADLYLVSSGTPWANQVVKGQNITYTVKAHLANVNAADFVLTYPAELTYVSSTASGSLGTEELIADTTLRTLKFRGYNTVNVTGDLPLFTVTFTGSTAGANKPLSFSYRTTSGFAMVGFESSTNVFVNEMVNGEVTIIDLPTISSTDIQGYYLSGEQRQFSVILDNPLTGADYAHVYVDFTIANAQVEQIDAIEYSVDNGATWVALGTGPGTSIANSGSDVVGYFGKITGGGFPLASDDNLTTLFRVTFKTREQGATDYPNSYSISMSLKDADTADPDTELAAFNKTAYVYDKPTLTSTDIQGYYLVGEERAFHVQVVNPATGGSFTSIYYNFEIANAAPADIASLVCGGQTISLSQSGTKLVGSTGPFPMPAGQSWNTPCSVKFNTAKNYAFTVYMTDSIPDPDRTLVTYTQTANVYTPPTLTSSDIVGPYLAGVPQDFHVTVNNPATGGSFVDSIYYVFTIADAELEDIYSLVCDGNSVTFTQSGSSLVGRTGYAGHGFPMPAGQEWITTCNVLFKNAGSYTFTVDMVDNPSGEIANDRILVSMSQTATVNSGFAITGTFSMQGNASRAGIPVTLTWAGTGWTYGPSANTTSAISNNFSLSVLYGGEYTITTLQPRYLNVYADTLFSKKITVAGPYNMSALILKGGNAYWRVSDTVLDNTINTSDSSIVGTQYGGAGSDAGFGNHGDCNFDGTVNIQDLALVGGNWSLTSATAYTTWLP